MSVKRVYIENCELCGVYIKDRKVLLVNTYNKGAKVIYLI